MIEWVACPVTYTLQHNGFEIGVHPENPVFKDVARVCMSTHPSNGKFVTVKVYKSDSITKGFVEINEFLADYLGFIEGNLVLYTYAQLTADEYITFFCDNVTKLEKERNNMENNQSVKDDNNMKHVVNNPSFDPSYFIEGCAYQVDNKRTGKSDMLLVKYEMYKLTFCDTCTSTIEISIHDFMNFYKGITRLIPEDDNE